MAPEKEIRTEFVPGSWAADRDSDNGDRVLILEQLDVPAGEYIVPGQNVSIAEYNDSPANDSVVTVVFVESLNRNWDAWGTDGVLALYNEGDLRDCGVQSYAYPASRLTLIHSANADD